VLWLATSLVQKRRRDRSQPEQKVAFMFSTWGRKGLRSQTYPNGERKVARGRAKAWSCWGGEVEGRRKKMFKGGGQQKSETLSFTSGQHGRVAENGIATLLNAGGEFVRGQGIRIRKLLSTSS